MEQRRFPKRNLNRTENSMCDVCIQEINLPHANSLPDSPSLNQNPEFWFTPPGNALKHLATLSASFSTPPTPSGQFAATGQRGRKLSHPTARLKSVRCIGIRKSGVPLLESRFKPFAHMEIQHRVSTVGRGGAYPEVSTGLDPGRAHNMPGFRSNLKHLALTASLASWHSTL